MAEISARAAAKTLIFRGQEDIFFTTAGAEALLREVPKAQFHRLAAGHFAVEDNLGYIVHDIKQFYDVNFRPKH